MKVKNVTKQKAWGYASTLQMELTLPERFTNSTLGYLKSKTKSKEQNVMDELGLAKGTKF